MGDQDLAWKRFVLLYGTTHVLRTNFLDDDNATLKWMQTSSNVFAHLKIDQNYIRLVRESASSGIYPHHGRITTLAILVFNSYHFEVINRWRGHLSREMRFHIDVHSGC
uniref:AlNc14C67G4744 protein n=1 Tax=Albugo laibachii Nc14 TaxID=890382 RepID=F0WDM4_9STRA|nr:AlNc14C67G4744 [Albugo laibachii Nc14]|eukprot:CCA19299.1 AlNc14C67G4744 [Albugo laibachii Nc14]